MKYNIRKVNYNLTNDEMEYIKTLRHGEKRLQILRLKEQGYTLSDIGLETNNSMSAIQELLTKTVSIIGRYRRGWTLPARVMNTLYKIGLLDENNTLPRVDEFKNFLKIEIEKGRLTQRKYKNKFLPQQYGKDSHNQLLKWVGYV